MTAARVTSDRLITVLVTMASQGLRPSDAAAEANGERFGTWAGRDRTRAPGKAKTP